MNSRILAVGNDEGLLKTRVSILNTRWSARTARCEGVLHALEEEPFGLLLLCHSIPDQEAQSLVRAARKQFPNIRILALESSWGSAARLGADATASTLGGPSQMLQAIETLLRGSENPGKASNRL